MAQQKRSPDKSQTKIIPPKKKQTASLSRDEIRYLNKKKVKRKRRAKKIFFGTLFTGVIIAVFVLLVLTFAFKIEKTEIKGSNHYEDKVVLKESGIEIGESLFSITEKELNSTLPVKLPYIKRVELKRTLPGTITLELFATREKAAFITKDGYVLVDDTGKVLDNKSQMLRDNVAVVSGAKPKKFDLGKKLELKTAEQTENFLTVLKGIKQGEMNNITEISMDKNGEFSLIYENRIKIKLGSTENLLVKLERAKASIDKENAINPYSEGVLDLSVEPNAYFSSGEEKEITASPDFVVDKNNNLVTDKNGEPVTKSSNKNKTKSEN